jgi:hypothetical protein
MAETFLIAIGGSSAGLSPNELSDLRPGSAFSTLVLERTEAEIGADVHSVRSLFVRRCQPVGLGTV